MTTPHTFVGFVADFPARNEGDQPAGKELAQFLHAHLTAVGLAISAPEDREGWAWQMFTRNGELEVTTIVGEVDDMEASPPRQWLVTNDCAVPFLKKVFRGTEFEAKRVSLLRKLCEELHTVMSNDSRFSHITWYDANTFDKPGDIPSEKP